MQIEYYPFIKRKTLFYFRYNGDAVVGNLNQRLHFSYVDASFCYNFHNKMAVKLFSMRMFCLLYEKGAIWHIEASLVTIYAILQWLVSIVLTHIDLQPSQYME